MRVRPLEVVNLAAVFLLSALTLFVARRLANPGGILLRYGILAAGVAGVAALARREERLPAPLRILVNFYPMALIPLLYESLGPLIPAVNPHPRDSILIAADRALFGRDATVLLEPWTRPWLTDALFVAYLTYYFIAIALGVVMWAKDRTSLRRFVFTLTLSYFASYAGYFVVPALGPRYALADKHFKPIAVTATSQAIVATLDELEHTKFDVFPSGHTMIAVVVLLVAWKRARRVFWILLPIASALVVSTVYCRYHYVVDLVAGTILAFVCVPVGDGIYDRWMERSKVPGPRSNVGAS